MTTDAGLLGSSAVNGIASILNAQNSYSQGYGFEDASSWGSSSAKSFDNLDAWSLGESWSKGDSQSSSQSSQGSQSSEWSQVYGKEASAADIERAAEANQIQRDLWSEQADYNAKQAEIDREFQREMSNTAYQRAVIDLIKAGLNPILAVGNMGASTPVGAMATSGLATSHKAQTFADQRSEGQSSSWGSSSSSSWSRDRSKSQNASKTTGRAESESYSSQGSSSHSENRNRSKTTTQLNDVLNFGKDQIALLDKMLNAGSGKDVSKTYGAKSGGGGGGGAY